MLTAMAAALVAPQSDAEVAALAAGEAYPVLATDDAPEARRVVSDSLRAAIAASPGLPGAQTPMCQLWVIVRLWLIGTAVWA